MLKTKVFRKSQCAQQTKKKKKIKKSLPTKVLITSAYSTNPNFTVREESFIKESFTTEIGLTANVKAKENNILCNLTTHSKVKRVSI